MEELATLIIGGFISLIVQFAKKYSIKNPLVIVAFLSVLLAFAYRAATGRGYLTEDMITFSIQAFGSAVTIYNVVKAVYNKKSLKTK